MKIIFLDVDGVLNSESDSFDWNVQTDYHFELLKSLVDKTQAKIVLSSSWRKSQSNLKIIKSRLQEFDLEVYDITPCINSPDVRRGDEIRQWIDTQDISITSFVILDDNSDMCEYTNTNLVQTDVKVGFQKQDYEKALEVLSCTQIKSYKLK